MPAFADQAQVLVWGGGSGGVAAALQAARGGADTLLLTPGPWLGGMVSAAGVCCPDGHELSPWQTGLWGAFLRELERREPSGLDHNWVSCFGYRPDTAEAILQEWVGLEPRLRWWPGVVLRGVRRRGSRITAVEIERQGAAVLLALEVLIDGSDLGDGVALAEAPFRLGWEPQELWGEPSAPARQRLAADPFFRRQPVQSPTWVVMGQLVPDVPPAPGAKADPAPQLPPPFEEACQAFGLARTLTYGRLPGGLVMLNWPLHGNDWHGELGRAFDPDPATQASLAAAMQAHSLAFAAALRQASDGWLQTGRAFPSEAGPGAQELALMPYWREGRRMVGRQVVTEHQLLPQGPGEAIGPLPRDGAGALEAIAVGTYANDHHYPGDDWPLAPKSCRWGGRWSGTPFSIPWGALVCEGIDNLLAADKAFSTSHMANGATRLQPLILSIGQVAGAAAALAVARGCPPAELPVRSIQEVLLQDPIAPAAVVPLWDTPWHHPRWRQRQRAILDNPDLLPLDGRWPGQAGDPAGPVFPGPQSTPGERLERLWRGELRPDGTGGYGLAVAEEGAGQGRFWPVITLEPALHRWLQQQSAPRTVAMIGCANPWGPWLRLSRLAEEP